MEEITKSTPISFSVSIVSHGQMGMVTLLLQDIQTHCSDSSIELILTLNLAHEVEPDVSLFSFPVRMIKNTAPKGFGANHNQAFRVATGQYFCVVNPDIRLEDCPFAGLQDAWTPGSLPGIVAPLVVAPGGQIEDSARRFPTPVKILEKLLVKPQAPDYQLQLAPQAVDWVGGMFMLFERQVFTQLKGFDERYFLYYEDVDICARANLLGLQVLVCPQVRVIHHAQRSSHRRLNYLMWHLRSMARFFLSPVYRQLKNRPLP